MNLQTERLRGLPAHPDEMWQGGLLMIPGGAVTDDDGNRIKPTTCLWISAATGRVHMGDVGPPESVTPAVVVATMVAFATDPQVAGYRPGRLEVADPAHAAALTEVVGPLGITVAVVGRLAGIEFMAAQLGSALPGLMEGAPPPPLADDPAITPQRLAAFAEAAAAFYAAAPWRQFAAMDLVRVVSPQVPKRLAFLNIMGGGGEQFGVAFFPSAEAFGQMIDAEEPGEFAANNPMVSVTFDTADNLPPGDVAAWKSHGLPTAKRGKKPLYPFPVTFDRGTWTRPTAAELATMEGLLRAVAAQAAAPDAVWSADVTTADGPVSFRFETLAEPPDPMAGLSPLSAFGGLADPPATEAERLIAQAQRSTGGKAIDLARRAVAADPDAVDAYVLLGDRAATPQVAVDFYRQGIAAGERVLGPDFFAENAGHFWGIVQTRPYMRALGGLANAHRAVGNFGEAIRTWQRMLELNPGDNQGVRDLLAPALMVVGRDADLSALFAQYPDDGGVVHEYGVALLKFRAEGDTPAAAELLAAAIKSNRHLVPFLTGDQRPPARRPAMYSWGDVSEAETFAADLVPGWRATRGAADWVRSHAPAAAAKPKAKKAAKKVAKKAAKKTAPRSQWILKPPGES